MAIYSYIDKFITACIVAISLVLIASSIGFTQNLTVQTSANYRLEDKGKDKVVSDYSLKSGITVKKALENLSQEENLILSYDPDLLESNQTISVKDNQNHNSIDKVLQEILSETELEYKILKTRHLVIYDRGKVGHVEGKVVDSESWDYLTGAKLQLKKVDTDSTGEETIEKVTFVDSTGRYDINNVKKGTYKMIITMDGYEQVSKTVEIQNKQTAQEIIKLERN